MVEEESKIQVHQVVPDELEFFCNHMGRQTLQSALEFKAEGEVAKFSPSPVRKCFRDSAIHAVVLKVGARARWAVDLNHMMSLDNRCEYGCHVGIFMGTVINFCPNVLGKFLQKWEF